VVNIKQGKTKAKLRIAVEGELAVLLERLRSRKVGSTVHNTYLIVSERGEPVSVTAMSRRWAKACAAAGIEGLQFRDLRAKAGTDKADSANDIREAQAQLGHSSVTTTEIYVRKKRGSKATPTR